MAYTGDLQNNLVDRVRFLVGDIDPKQEFMSDAEYQALLAMNANDPMQAAIQACYGIIGRLGSWFDQSVGGVSMSYSQIKGSFVDTLARLKTQLGTSGGYNVYAGGVSVADKRARALNRDRPARDFRRDPDTAAAPRHYITSRPGPYGI